MKKSVVICALLCACCVLFSGCGVKTIEGFEESVCAVSQISVPEQAQLIALGEATHGNAEFQQLKLDVLKVLVEKDNVRAFALEGDFGCCEVANRYIQGGEGTAEEAAAAIGFQIYRTSQMAELIKWMRDYNSAAPESEKLRFYGFDMQRVESSLGGIQDYFTDVNAANAADYSQRLSRLYDADGTHSMDAQLVAERRSVLVTMGDDLEQNRETYIEASSEPEYEYACQYVRCLTQNLELSLAGNYDYSTIRDEYMAANVDWILKTEALYGNDRVMLSGHNGHVAMLGSSYTNMGSILEEEHGESYFVIGTDFYKTTCNFPDGEGRANHSVKSADPLAACLKGAEENMMYMDFASVTSPAIRAIIDAPMKMGSLGESWVWYMKLLPQSYRIEQTPTALYDGMIFVYNATPTEIAMG